MGGGDSMMIMAQRSGDDGRVTVANSYKRLHQPGALGNECTTVISKPPHTPLQQPIARPVLNCASTTLNSAARTPATFLNVSPCRPPAVSRRSHPRNGIGIVRQPEEAGVLLRHVFAADFMLRTSLKHA